MTSPLRELDHRSADGIDVRMLWHPTDNHVLVSVSDSKTGDAFTLEVAPGRRAYDVFHHPYAFAAGSGPGLGVPVTGA